MKGETMETSNLIPLGVDAGNGAFKLYGAAGGLELISQVAVNDGQKTINTLGLRSQKTPLRIVNHHGSFYVGVGAHDFGRPVENLDVDRFNGTPEMQALLHGSFTRYQQRYGVFSSPLSVVVGVTTEALANDSAGQNSETIREWIRGLHSWTADGQPDHVEMTNVKVASQASAELFDYLLDGEGQFIHERKGAFTGEVGTISIGFGTVELMVVRNRMIVQRFTSSSTSGVRRLLEILDGGRLYSLGELDAQLRAGHLDTREALPIWEREVSGFIEKAWGKSWKRFAAILIVGGGSILLKNSLPYHFNGKAFMPEDPVMSIARGLYKLALFQSLQRKGQ
jgi:Actin like proteins N terminal domain